MSSSPPQHRSSLAASEPDAGPKRVVVCGDALAWLAANAPLEGCSVITSLPDVSAFARWSVNEWKGWFTATAGQILAATSAAGVTIFYQTDVKRDGVWIDKGYLCQRAAEEVGSALLWHKIVCRKPPGAAVFGRPGYTHMLCFSKGVADSPAPYPDVLESTGMMTWSQAMGVAACELACRYVMSHTATRTIVDPFCGVGTVLAVANGLGLEAVGVEIANKRARKARTLRWPSRQIAEGAEAD